MLAITRSFPPQRRQVSMSTRWIDAKHQEKAPWRLANTRLRRCAQVSARCRSVADGSLGSTALPAAATRVFETTRARSGLAGANTPWNLVRCARGLGTSATSRAIKSSGSTKSPGAILNSRRLVRRTEGRMPGVTSRGWCRPDRVRWPGTSLCPALWAAFGRANWQSCQFVSVRRTWPLPVIHPPEPVR